MQQQLQPENPFATQPETTWTQFKQLLGVKKSLTPIEAYHKLYDNVFHGDTSSTQESLTQEVTRSVAHAYDNQILFLAVDNGATEIVEMLLEIQLIKDNAHVKDNEALISAAKKGYIQIVKQLIKIPKVKGNAHTRNNAAIRFAAEEQHAKIVWLLLDIPEIKENIHTRNNQVLVDIALHGHSGVMLDLLRIDAVKKNAHAQDNQALINAAEKGHKKTVEWLLKKNKFVRDNAHTRNNMALSSAIQHGHPDVVKLLIDMPNVCRLSEAYFQAQDAFLDQAIARSGKNTPHNQVLLALLAVPIISRIAHCKDNSFLAIAAKHDYIDVVTVLVALPNVIEGNHIRQSLYALTHAIEQGYFQIVQLLLTIPAIHRLAYNHIGESLANAAKHHEEKYINIVKLLVLLPNIHKIDATYAIEALIHMAENGPIKSFELLLTIPPVKANAHAKDNMALLNAAKRSDSGNIQRLGQAFPILESLVELPNVQNGTHHSQLIEIFIQAVKNNNLKTIQLLLSIPYIRNNAHAHNNAALHIAFENRTSSLNNSSRNIALDILKLLLALPNVQACNLDKTLEIFIQAVKDVDVILIEFLLTLPIIRDNAHIQDNLALMSITGFHAKNERQKSSGLRMYSTPLIDHSTLWGSDAFVRQWGSSHYTDVRKLRKKAMVIAKLLASLPSVQNGNHTQSIQHLAQTAKLGRIELVRLLLSIPMVRYNAHADNNIALRNVIAADRPTKAHLNITSLLVGLPEVQEGNLKEIIAFVKKTLSNTIAHDVSSTNVKHHIARLLLTIPFVQSACVNYTWTKLPNATNVNVNLFRSLLRISALRDSAHQNNRLLEKAVNNKRIKATRLLLEIPAVRDNAHANDFKILTSTVNRKDYRSLSLLLSVPTLYARAREDVKNKSFQAVTSEIAWYIAGCQLIKSRLSTQTKVSSFLKKKIHAHPVWTMVTTLFFCMHRITYTPTEKTSALALPYLPAEILIRVTKPIVAEHANPELTEALFLGSKCVKNVLLG